MQHVVARLSSVRHVAARVVGFTAISRPVATTTTTTTSSWYSKHVASFSTATTTAPAPNKQAAKAAKQAKEPVPPPQLTSDLISSEIDEILSRRRQVVNAIALPTKRTGTNSILAYFTNKYKLSADNVWAHTRIAQTYAFKLSTDPRKLSSAAWKEIGGPSRVRSHALGLGIFPDLIEEFRPSFNVTPEFEGEIVAMRGNKLAPSLAKTAPTVHFDAPNESFYTLLAVDIDALAVDHEPIPEEYSRFVVSEFKTHRLHWLVTNIPGNQVAKGEQVTPWMQPLPAKGTGEHRIVFLLCSQEQAIAVPPAESFDARIEFPTAELLESKQLTPCGMAFFQASWDQSVSEYYKQLAIVEPVYATAQQANKIIKRENRQVTVSRFRLATE